MYKQTAEAKANSNFLQDALIELSRKNKDLH